MPRINPLSVSSVKFWGKSFIATATIAGCSGGPTKPGECTPGMVCDAPPEPTKSSLKQLGFSSFRFQASTAPSLPSKHSPKTNSLISEMIN
jgi:hypothetical protein